MRITFEYDCLKNETFKKYIIFLLGQSFNNVAILTKRADGYKKSDDTDLVKECAKELDIPVIFTGNVDKVSYLNEYKIDIHYDDSAIVVNHINTLCNTLTFLVPIK